MVELFFVFHNMSKNKRNTLDNTHDTCKKKKLYIQRKKKG